MYEYILGKISACKAVPLFINEKKAIVFKKNKIIIGRCGYYAKPN